MPVVTMKQLLEAGVHFGHRSRRWNPKMRRFIFTERNNIHIIDLQQTMRALDRMHEYVRDTVAEGGTILFVGTKRQAQENVQAQAIRCGMPYVTQRWLGGTLTNFRTIRSRIDHMIDLERQTAKRAKVNNFHVNSNSLEADSVIYVGSSEGNVLKLRENVRENEVAKASDNAISHLDMINGKLTLFTEAGLEIVEIQNE